MKYALCRGQAFSQDREKDRFFPGRGETPLDAVATFCFDCIVKPQCNDFGDRVGAKTGVWGGKRRTRQSHGNEKQ